MEAVREAARLVKRQTAERADLIDRLQAQLGEDAEAFRDRVASLTGEQFDGLLTDLLTAITSEEGAARLALAGRVSVVPATSVSLDGQVADLLKRSQEKAPAGATPAVLLGIRKGPAGSDGGQPTGRSIGRVVLLADVTGLLG